MSSKVIKKILRILLYFIGGILLLFIISYYALRSPVFQTWASNRAGWYFSKQWGTTVRVEGVDIEFWKKVVLEGVYVEDQHRDTLLFAEKLKIDIGTFDPDSQNIFINDMILQNATVKFRKYAGDSALNFQFIVDEFTSNDTTVTDSSKWNIGIESLTLDNVRFLYRDEQDTSSLKGINFSDISAINIHGKISDIAFSADTTYCMVNNFSFKEKSGFVLKKLSAKGSISPVLLQLDELRILSNRSSIVTDISFHYKTYDDFNHFVGKVKMKSQFKSSNIEMGDVAYFFPELYGLKKKIFLDGTVGGKVSDLKGRNILLAIGNEASFKGNFDMTGLPDIDQTFMSFDAKEFRTSKKGIEGIPLPPFNEQHSIALPENISLFGDIKFKGNFSGFYNDFVSYGKFSTALGNISTDISLKNDSSSGKSVYHGKFACTDFNLGKFFESEKYFGRISLNAIIDGKGFKKTNAVASVEGVVSSLEMNGYNYRNIDVKGKLARNVFDGTLSVNDENLILDFNGDIDFSKSPTHVNFTTDIAKADLSALNFIRSADIIGVRAKIDVNAVGNTLDDVTGTMNLDDIAYLKGSDVFDFKDVKMLIEERAGIKSLYFYSSVADANLSGKFKLTEIATGFTDFLSHYLPAYIPHTVHKHNHGDIEGKDLQEQEFDLSIKFHNTDIATSAFMPSLKIACPAAMQMRYDQEVNELSFSGDFPAVSVQGYKFKKCALSAVSNEGQLSFSVNCQRLALSDSAWIDSVLITSAIARDTANFRINWHNSTKVKYEGDIPGYVAFSEKPKVKLKLLPSFITIADSSWKLNADNVVVMDSSFISVKNLDFSCGNQRVKLEGNISEIKGDQLYLMLSSFSLENFNTYLKGTDLSFYGNISGNTSIANIYDKPLFGSSIDIKTLRINKELIGDGNMVSIYDSKKDMLNFNGGFSRGEGENMKLSGNYYPSKRKNSLEVDAEIHDFRLDFFDPFIKDNFESLKGIAAAELKIKGTPDAPLLTGVLKAKVDNIHVNYLGTNYHFEGDIALEPGYFDFANLIIFDSNNNKAEIINGKIFHNNYKDFQMDFDMNLNKFLCLNTTEKDNSIYYGKVFSTGILNVFGFLDHVNLSAAVKTDKAKNPLGKNEYSQLFIPLSGSEEVGENGFISFVKKDTSLMPEKYKVSAAGFTMDFQLQPTPDAQVQLIFDEKVGDIIKANGSGDLRIVINEFGEFKMYGDYTVEEGDYLFTLKNVVNKKFRLEKGGFIHWSGNPEDADMNMSAIYELRTSLTPLFLSHEHTDAVRKRYPIDCVMKLSGKLMEPDIVFDIQMPTVDDFTRQQAYDKFKNSESEVNKQVFSLMFTNSFSPAQGQGQGETSGGAGAGTVTTSTEMLSNQLSNWLSQISNEFDVGVHYRMGDEVNKDQVELALSTQLFNDKMNIDGSVANSSNPTTQNAASVVGDINVDYKLTEDGKFRAKAYNKANEGDVLNTQKGPYTQGLGVFYREEFETVGELYRRYLGKLKKKKHTP